VNYVSERCLYIWAPWLKYGGKETTWGKWQEGDGGKIRHIGSLLSVFCKRTAKLPWSSVFDLNTRQRFRRETPHMREGKGEDRDMRGPNSLQSVR
jgi:hypothetical protein